MLKDIVLAGLLHDVGKFAERAWTEEFGQITDDELGRFNYPHAAATERFLTKYVNVEGRQPPWFNYAAMHHKPSDNEPFQWMLAEADRLSSGMERATYAAEEREVGAQTYKTPLKPVTEFIALQDETPIDGEFYLPLKALSVEREQIFPRRRDGDLNLQEDYAGLFDQFVKEFEKLLKYHIRNKIDTLYFLLQKYWWAVPSTVRKQDFPDISLFEHAKTTAALASCLYLYHNQQGGDGDVQAIRNRKVEKFLLFAGDIGGIQNFIYQISSKGAYSLLKGRSFYIQILSDIAAMTIVEAVGLTRVNIIYSSGGKFYILLPNTEQTKQKLKDLIEQINADLFEKFDGELFLRTGWAALSGNDLMLENDRLSAKWNEVNAHLQKQAQQPFASLLRNTEKFREIFGPGDWDMETCQACHKEVKKQAIVENKKGVALCPVCAHLEKLGNRLKNAKYLVLTKQVKAPDQRDIFLGTSIFLHDELKEDWLKRVQQGDLLLQLNNTSFDDLLQSKTFTSLWAREMKGASEVGHFQVGFQYYGGTRRLDATFDEIADRTSCDFRKLGILRMDVDNLGKIFSRGLRHYRVKPRDGSSEAKNFYSLARMTTLSAQLNLFFSGYLNQLISDTEETKAAIVYAGGDDLFIVGAWDEVMEKAVQIRKEFEDFTCHNPSFTMSGGLAITDGKFPIYKSAEYAGQAEEQAKKFGNGQVSKNAFTAFGACLSWPEWMEVNRWKSEMLKQLWSAEKQNWDRALINHLWRIVDEYQRRYVELQRQIYNEKQIRKLVRHERWLWRMVYDLTRFKQRNKNLTELVDHLMAELAGDQREQAGRRPFIELLPALTQWVDYLTR